MVSNTVTSTELDFGDSIPSLADLNTSSGTHAVNDKLTQLQQYNLEITHRAGKDNLLPDILSRLSE